ncbi:hypothetical protein A9Z42_0050450 [Trichoderma parareesei]|uniref:DUF3752 domain-containing protein n=1 Tax=Trichoderma parareesei TaxID=858221 RepID=A0A2H2ZBB7_TRIPA|nr:hypothetical protein A9Z42_0050450 [Trichoderma parareesei]
MSSIGPQLPPHLTKRRRDSDTDDDDDDNTSSNKHARRDDPPPNQDEIDLNASASSDSEDDYAPPKPPSQPTTAPSTTAPAPKAAVVGPTLPPHLLANNTTTTNKDEIALDNSDSEDTGPAPPSPPSFHPTANTNPDDSESSDDDSFGPSLPTAATRRQIGPSMPPSTDDDAPKRDEWMLAPPPSSNTFSERDTTRIRARKFASKPSAVSAANASAGGPASSSIWTETPEEKLRRLQDSVLGRTSSDAAAAQAGMSEKQLKKLQRDEALSASIQATRGKTLLEEHQGGGSRKSASSSRGKVVGAEEEEDDPSKRAFDREKDMAVGGRITATQRRELINKSANFGGRFQKGSFL